MTRHASSRRRFAPACSPRVHHAAVARGARGWSAILLATWFGVIGCRSLRADDLVILESDNGQESTQRAGEILDFTGRHLLLRTSTGREARIDAARVREARTRLDDLHQQADAKFAARDFGAARDLYERTRAEKRERRAWVLRRILEREVWCSRNLGQYDRAAESFFSLVQSDPLSPGFRSIPLVWSTRSWSPAIERAARAWLTDVDRPVAQLVGASWLLSTSDRGQALDTLAQLVRDKDQRIASLADAQQWRAEFVSADAQQIAGWADSVARMPIALRGGPYFVLGQALARHRQLDAAALALLRVPSQYGDDRPLAAIALALAGRALEADGHVDEATALYRQLLSEYPDSDRAADVRERVNELRKKTGGKKPTVGERGVNP